MTDFTYRYGPGVYNGREYHIGVRTDPSLFQPRSFAVVLFYERPDGTTVEVAKIDNSSHAEGDIHVDRYYRERGAPRKDFDVDISTLPEAERYLRENWRRFAILYDRTHG